MELTVIGSGSDGNGYLLQADDGATLFIECGVPLLSYKRALDYNMSNLRGILVTHEHGDHAGRCKEFLNDTTAPMLMSRGTWEAIAERCKARREPTVAEHSKAVQMGSYNVLPLLLRSANGNLTHDAAEPICYVISHPEMGKMLFLTDSYCCPYNVKGLSQVLIECNYDIDILEERYRQGLIDPKRRRRTIESHMSLTNCIHELQSMDLSGVMNIVLIHVSNDNGHREHFITEVGKYTHKRVIMAENGLKTILNKDPF